MKTKLRLIGLLLIVANIAVADRISEEQALAIAKDFTSGNGGAAMSKANGKAANTMTLAHSSTGYYAFDRGENSGYVLVAADDRAISSVLGYADSGSFPADSMPDNMRYWLSEYDRQIEYIAANATSVSETRVATREYADIPPMLTCTWNQNDPFNKMCPTIGSNNCPTGCLATAMAQIMYYHKWPEQGSGSKTYSSNGLSLSVDFSESIYDWNSMTDVYDNNSTEEEEDAVAKLMYDVGVSCEMSYRAASSGAVSNKSFLALYNYFGYDKGVNYYKRNSFEYSEWIEMLYNELAEGRPVLYCGYNSSSSGHAFVCDGYQDGYFHINWGWSGSSNGYFLITALYPSSQGTGGGTSGYYYNHDATMGIMKPEEGSLFNPIIYCGDFATLGENTYDRSENVTFGNTFEYYGLENTTVTFGIQVIDSNSGDTTYVMKETPNTYEATTSRARHYIFQFSIPLSDFPTANGNYLVYPVFLDEYGRWNLIRSDGNRYLTATVDGNTITFAEPEEKETILSATDVTVTSSVFAGKAFMASATLSNDGAEYYGNVKMVVMNTGTTTVVTESSNMMVNIPEGESTTVDFKLTAPSATGTYTLAVTDENYNIIGSTITMTVRATPTGELSITLNSLEVENADNVIASNIRVTANVTCNSGYFNDKFTGFIYEKNTNTSKGYISSETVIIGAGDTQTIELSGSLSTLEEGKSYTFRLYYYIPGGYYLIGSSDFTVGAITGIDNVTAESESTEAVDIQIYNLKGGIISRQRGSRANLSGMPSGVYLVRDGGEVKKVIK